MRPTNLRAHVILWLAGMPLGCDANFETRFSQLKSGDSQARVEQLLGRPANMTKNTLPKTPFSGPQEELVSSLGFGAPYEEWRYQSGPNEFYVWFGSSEGKPSEQWIVVSTARYPRGAVF